MVENSENNECYTADTSLTAALADREAYQINQEIYPSIGGFDFATPGDFRDISPGPCRMIVNHETGGRNYYEKVYGGRPVWPGDASGVIIGFGYDPGYVSADGFRSDRASLTPPQINVLLSCIGKHGGNRRLINCAFSSIPSKQW